MKTIKYLFAAVLALLAIGCSEEETSNSTPKYAPVTVHVNDFSMSVVEFSTRAEQNVADYTDVGAITLAFYNGTTEVFKHTQLRSDNTTYTTFGNFSCDLPIGNYTMVVIGRGHFDGDVFTLSSPTSAGYTSERARETFNVSQPVTVTNTAPLALDVTLSRIVSFVQINSTDGRSAGATKIRTTYAKGSKSFNPSTGLASDDTGFSVINNPSTAVGATISVGSFLFLASDEETVNITLEALDASNNVLFTKVVENVPLKRNRKTTLTGAMFTAPTSTAAFKVETAWLDGNTVSF